MNELARTPGRQNRKDVPAFWRQVLEILPAIIISSIVALGAAAFTIWLARYTDNPVWKLVKDPAQVIGYPPYFGILSNWDAVLWTAAAAICLFASVVMKKYGSDPSMQRFLFFSGMLSFLLGMDDLFLLHDEILPHLFDIPELVFYMLYLLIMLVYLAFFIRHIFSSDYILFWTAFLLLVFSRGFYNLVPAFREFDTAGDMLKYFGIVFWLAFFYRTALKQFGLVIGQR